MTIEEALWGTTKVRCFFAVATIFFFNILYGILAGNKELITPMIIIIIAIIMIILRAIMTGNKAYKLYGNRKFRYSYVFDENKISFEIYNEDELKDEGIYKYEDIVYFHKVTRYSFICFKDGKLVFLDNEAFQGEDYKRIRELIKSSQKTEQVKKCDNKYDSKVFWITFTVGVVISFIVALIYVNNASLNDSIIEIYLKISFSGIIFFLFMAAGIVEFINWFKEKSTIWRVLAIVFYPLTIGAVYCVGIKNVILFLLRKIKTYCLFWN